MKKTAGIFAHVDAGKTTFSERLLFQSKSTKTFGAVEEGTTVMDRDEIERKRGITIFADQAYFTVEEDEYFLVDTPGHTDFSAEAERTMEILDFAVLLIDGTEGVKAHTVTLFQLLQRYEVPVILFINKMDREGACRERAMESIREKLTGDALFYEADFFKKERTAEFCADRSETFLEHYLSDTLTETEGEDCFRELFENGGAFPVFCGSALTGEGFDELFQGFSLLVRTGYETRENDPFQADVYKIRCDDKGNRITFMKIKEGSLAVKQEFTFLSGKQEVVEKVNEIRVYNGGRFERRDCARAGDVVGVTGLKTPVCQTRLFGGEPACAKKARYFLNSAIQVKAVALDGTDENRLLSVFRILEDEDPALSVTFREADKALLVHIMGKIQLEVLEQILENRFGIKAAFEKPEVEYKETIVNEVECYGHFEPLRHYAEVKLCLKPGKRGSGVTFESHCPVDVLSLNFQRLIETHVMEKEHRGVLTGSPVTDIQVILKNGRSHIKHTEGGDFREAVYRAVRQGLFKAESRLLEPFYALDFFVPEEHVGRVLSDIQKGRGSFPALQARLSGYRITGRGPVSEFMDYAAELSAYTKGKGSLSLVFDGYDFCENEEEVIQRIGYERERDVKNPASSVFCAKGAAFTVPWDRADDYMHTRKDE